MLLFNDDSIKKFQEIRKKEEEKFTMRMAQIYNLPYLNLFVQTINPEAVAIIDEETAKKGEIVAIQKKGKDLKVCIKNPNNPETKKVLKDLKDKGYVIDVFLVSPSGLKKVLSYYENIKKQQVKITETLDITEETLWKIKNQIKNIDDFKKLYEENKNKNTTMMLELIVAGALSLDSSDIHIEPFEGDEARVRFRIDGILYEVINISKETYNHLLNRIKLLSKVKLNVKDRPQDGRFSIITSQGEIEVRTSVLPGPNGESVVLRVLDPTKIIVSIDQLGLSEYDLNLLEKEIKRPNGMLIVTGPTGSGKTTTLYSFIRKINSPGIKIITIEDPIEYHLKGISQSQIDESAGYTFAMALRSILRQDPDVILLGEIRDEETADTAIHAALTGHLVFSTLHTNNAPATILRLIDMKLNPTLIAPAVNVIIAQRLVRKVCKNCSTKKEASEEEIKILRDTLLELKDNPKVKLPDFSQPILIPKVNGCENCNFIGYKGRIGIFEVFPIDKSLENVIISNPTQEKLTQIAKEKGMIEIKQDGMLKVIKGITTIDEVLRVTK